MDSLSFSGNQVQADLPYASLDMLSVAPDDKVFYRVIGPDGMTVTGYQDLPAVPGGFQKLSQSSRQQKTDFFDATYRGEPVRFVVTGREIAQPGAKGWVWTQVGQTKLARDTLARQLILNSVLPIIAVTILVLGFVWLGIGRALRPLQALGREIGGRDPSDLSPIVTSVPDEIVPVILALNGFMRRLEFNIEELRSFIADAAHQVRTPLAALIAQVQVASDAQASPDELRLRLAAVQRNAEKLARLANQLLSDATVRHRSALGRVEEFDLLQTIRHSIRDIVPLSEDSDVRLTTSLRQAPFRGDRFMLGEAVKNLVHNALCHSGDAEPDVRILLGRDEKGYVLRIADRGPGIPASEREHVFERFSRGTSTQSGTGLGLSIVRQVVHRHHGTISLHNRRGGGLAVQVCLPHEQIS